MEDCHLLSRLYSVVDPDWFLYFFVETPFASTTTVFTYSVPACLACTVHISAGHGDLAWKAKKQQKQQLTAPYKIWKLQNCFI